MAPNVPDEFQSDDVLASFDTKELVDPKHLLSQYNSRSSSAVQIHQSIISQKSQPLNEKHKTISNCDGSDYWEWNHEEGKVKDVPKEEVLSKDELLRNILLEEERFLSLTGNHIWKCAKEVSEMKHVKQEVLHSEYMEKSEGYWDWDEEQVVLNRLMKIDHLDRNVLEDVRFLLSAQNIENDLMKGTPTVAVGSVIGKHCNGRSGSYWDWQECPEDITETVVGTKELSKNEMLDMILSEETARLSLSGDQIIQNLMKAAQERSSEVYDTNQSHQAKAESSLYWGWSNYDKANGYWEWQGVCLSKTGEVNTGARQKKELISQILRDEKTRQILSSSQIENNLVEDSIIERGNKDHEITNHESAFTGYWD